MKIRIVRVEEGYWRIRSPKRVIKAEERTKLVEYFREIGFPYKLIGEEVCVPVSVGWGDISKRLEYSYDGEAEVYPF